MDKDDRQKYSSFDVLGTSSEILEKHGKSEEEIRVFLGKQFPINIAVMKESLETRKKDKP